jgi:hypothetical protein
VGYGFYTTFWGFVGLRDIYLAFAYLTFRSVLQLFFKAVESVLTIGSPRESINGRHGLVATFFFRRPAFRAVPRACERPKRRHIIVSGLKAITAGRWEFGDVDTILSDNGRLDVKVAEHFGHALSGGNWDKFRREVLHLSGEFLFDGFSD